MAVAGQLYFLLSCFVLFVNKDFFLASTTDRSLVQRSPTVCLIVCD
jgi:hypothetical protein